MQKPNWRFWLPLLQVELWEAVALSLDLNPDCIKPTEIHYKNSQLPIGAWKGGKYPSENISKQFAERLRILYVTIRAKLDDDGRRRAREGKIVPFGRTSIYKNDSESFMFHRSKVCLAEFSAWGLKQGFDMPPELVAMAQAPANQAAAPRASATSIAPAESKAQVDAGTKGETRKITVSSLKRSNVLAAVIETAKNKSQNSADYQSVWAELVKLAESPNRPAPLIGFADGEVKYQDGDAVKCLTKRNLADRMRRAAPSSGK